MRNKNTIMILNKFKDSLENDENNNELLDEYKTDAIDILLNEGFKIKPIEYRSLLRKSNNTKNYKFLAKKYENTLVYLIHIGCFDNLKAFKDSFLCEITNRFQQEYITNKKAL